MEQIIGIDFANENYGDWTAINSICSHCKSILETKTFHPSNNAPQMSVFINCPVCGVKFNRHNIREEY